MCRVHRAPRPDVFLNEELRTVDELLNQHRTYDLGAGFTIHRSASTDGKWGIYRNGWEIDYLIAYQSEKPRKNLTLHRFDTVTEAVEYVQSVLNDPKLLRALNRILRMPHDRRY